MPPEGTHHAQIRHCHGRHSARRRAASAQTIVQSRGVDARVDYASLLDYGPWDDRNYELNQDDLALLGENEPELTVRAPLFYRIEIRERFGNLPTTGPVQYPRSTLPRFLTEYGGFLIDGMLYRKAVLVGGRFAVDTSQPWMSPRRVRGPRRKSLTGDVRVLEPRRRRGIGGGDLPDQPQPGGRRLQRPRQRPEDALLDRWRRDLERGRGSAPRRHLLRSDHRLVL